MSYQFPLFSPIKRKKYLGPFMLLFFLLFMESSSSILAVNSSVSMPLPFFTRSEHEHHAFSRPESLIQGSYNPGIHASTVLPIGSKVLFQAYYWEPNNVMVPDNGAWWNGIKQRVPDLASAGFDSFWLPPPQKTPDDIIATMGYEPYDYYDLGAFNQKGRVRTRFGTQTELQDLISVMNQYGVAAIADIVINHNNGGKDEFNPNTGTITPTDFMDIASGVFPRNYTCFWPDENGNYDQLQFGSFPDLRHTNPYVHDELINWGKWLRDEIGYDGWRFDVAAGIIPEMLRDWMLELGNWGVAEYWILHDESLPLYTFDKQVKYLQDTNNTVNAFDFELRLTLRDMMLGDGAFDMTRLNSSGLLWNGYTDQAVTLVANHDTGRDSRISITRNKYFGYAYILTHEGYPSVYWMDYYDPFLGPHIQNLVKIHNTYAKGTTSILFANEDLYIAQRNGDPGLVVALNDNPTEWKEARIKTKWANTLLYEMTNQGLAPATLSTDSEGYTTIHVPPASYTVYTIDPPLLDTPLPPPQLATETFSPNTTITQQTISIDGKFTREWWGLPSLIDSYGDASRFQRDLHYLFMKHDQNNLYLGIYLGTRLETEPGMQLGIAISTDSSTGAEYAPYGHDEIRFMGSADFPNYMYFLDTNASDPWNDFATLTRFMYKNNAWDTGETLSPTRLATDPLTGFVELAIPLNELGLQEGGHFSIKLVTTGKDKPAGYDSLPNDNTIRGDGYETSWVKLSRTFTISEIPVTPTSSTTRTTKTPLPFLELLALLPLSQQLIRIRKRTQRPPKSDYP